MICTDSPSKQYKTTHYNTRISSVCGRKIQKHKRNPKVSFLWCIPMASRSSKRSISLGTTNEVEKIFNKFDKNGDGKISHDDLNDVLHALGSQMTSAEVSCIMSEIDKDDNSFINLNKFTEFHISGLTSLESFGIYELIAKTYLLLFAQ